MLASMMDQPLLISSLITHAARYHGQTEIVSRTLDEGIHRYTWADAERRSKQLAKALTVLGVEQGQRVATMAWNTYRHLEAYYAIAGMGAITHTVNPRLFPEQIEYLFNHAEDQYLFCDASFADLVADLLPKFTTLKGVIFMCDRANMPSVIPDALCYEELMASQDADYDWPVFDERNGAALCYTSGTTGNPKGALYSHRSTLLHTFAAVAPDGLSVSARETVLPVVPMFHVNAWGLPYACAMVGAKMVMPGRDLDGKSVHELLEGEAVTLTAAVPAVWLGLLNHLKATDSKLEALQRVVIGGSACPRAMMEAFQNDYGCEVIHAWGMTEMSPLGTVNTPMFKYKDLSGSAKVDLQQSAGRPLYGVDMMIVDENDKEMPWDGESVGELMVRGPWIIDDYFNTEKTSSHRIPGWFGTGDVVAIDADGYIWITDRIKDVIKSGGEWISSIDLENIAVGHPNVAEAAVIGIYHPRWDERPLLIIVRQPGEELSKDETLAWFDGKIAKWWTPDDVAFVDELPHTATGKLSKLQLRGQFKEYKLPTA
jgi:acyl-CoA synthetase (AMP-forming)/AMP-acid ligase II